MESHRNSTHDGPTQRRIGDAVATNERAVALPPPRVLACGYYCIASAKTNLTFPTFLINFPAEHGKQSPHEHSYGERSPSAWRSKRDFLRLGRAASKTIGTGLPKAALSKLAKSFPWKRPGCSWSVQSVPPTQAGAKLEAEKNVYHPSMKKSLHLLDRFLQTIHDQNDKHEQLSVAWSQFCQPKDTDGIFAFNSSESAQTSAALIERTNPKSLSDAMPSQATSIYQSSRLGQYFALPRNARQVAEILLETQVVPCFEDSSQHADHFVFLEPSCGRGDIIAALVEQLVERGVPSEEYSIIGIDLDANAIQECKRRNFGIDRTNFLWFHGDFLRSKKSDRAFEALFGALNQKCEFRLFCLGGPPYTAGAGNGGSSMMRDLPSLFVKHCKDEWQARAIIFIMPQRYKNNAVTLDAPWRHDNFELIGSSKFLFQGSTEVVQPSIIQLFSAE